MSGFHDEDGYNVPLHRIDNARPVWSPWPDNPERDDLDGSLQAAMALLTEKQRFVLSRRYGYGDERQPPMTLEELADIMGTTRQAVQGIEERALVALRRVLSA